jgi:hypothetical protein
MVHLLLKKMWTATAGETVPRREATMAGAQGGDGGGA